MIVRFACVPSASLGLSENTSPRLQDLCIIEVLQVFFSARTRHLEPVGVESLLYGPFDHEMCVLGYSSREVDVHHMKLAISCSHLVDCIVCAGLLLTSRHSHLVPHTDL
ncbi:hypothetical protein POSPLADRAFT_1065262 [Postia placenta MAD-698-R-SB12]|uniref:Uncharacterized protein n=1 Tax=Postia placenta MAD-698-R-SB12 TaxID=670580 RepID=A0A1X6NA22_9APHY|nr:hypothetical protein POSPLADRAFT_1065262 [Postia placenta MAD-698-R-SB12]OSX65497.1 hypothetical protein POSPLADRAFT_1065262 [Postia placenta MAD-698-R-SB12]